MKKISALIILTLVSCSLTFAQEPQPQSDIKEPLKVYINTFSTVRPRLADKLWVIDPNLFSGFWISLPSNNRVSFSSWVYRQDKLPFRTDHINYDFNLSYGKKNEFYKFKSFGFYVVGDFGIGKSKHDYDFSTEDEEKYTSNLYNFASGSASFGLELSIGKKILLVAESQYKIEMGLTKSRDYDMDTGLLAIESNNGFDHLQRWIPISALGIGWKI